MAQVHDRRRQHYGSIDFDFYRTQAVALRSQAKRDAFKHSAAFRFAMATFVTALVLALIPAMAKSVLQPNYMTALYPDKNLEKGRAQGDATVRADASGRIQVVKAITQECAEPHPIKGHSCR